MARPLCTKCALHETRINLVQGKGTYPADILFFGIAPGKDEDRKGVCFVGASGILLDQMLRDAVKHIKIQFKIYKPEFTYYVDNIVRCRPCDFFGAENRDPLSDEVFACKPHVQSVYRKVKPKITIFAGKIPAQYYKNVFKPNVVMWHPAALLRRGGVGAPEYMMNIRLLAETIREVL